MSGGYVGGYVASGGYGGYGSGGTVTLVVTAEPGNVPPRVRVEITYAGGPTVNVTRAGADGVAVPVRTGEPADTSTGSAILYDYEAPYNQAVVYQAGVTTAGVTLTVGQSWLIHAGIPSLSQPILPLGPIGDESKESTAGAHQVIGRRDPIIITDGTRKAPVFPLTVMTVTEDDEHGFDELILDTSPLLLQIVQVGESRRVYRWVSAGAVVMSAPGAFGDPTRVWSMVCVEIGRPVGGVQAQRTYTDVLAEAATYALLAARYTSYRGLLIGDVGT